MIRYDMPVRLTPARAWRTYLGGSQIDAIHGVQAADSQFPEEWIISCVTARNTGREQFPDEGLSYLAEDGISLAEYIRRDPASALGKDHCAAVGNVTGVLVKLIDAAERLTIQVHPNKEKAKLLFNSSYGKTECWHIVGGRTVGGEPPCIYLGFRGGITPEAWKQCFDRQDIPAMLGALHRFPVQPGETYLVQGGVPHAIGAGCLLIEIQEPTDYTIRTEWTTPNGLRISDFMCHQGLGTEKMFDCFEYEGLSAGQALARWRIPAKILEQSASHVRRELVGYDETSCFRLERYDIYGTCSVDTGDSFCGLYLLQGRGQLLSGCQSFSAAGGDQFFIPAGCHDLRLSAEESPLTVFLCFGPDIRA